MDLHVIVMWVFIIWAIINIMEFILMKIDKEKAKKNQYRISEHTLFYVAILGGALGGTFGMYHFRHKNQKWYFKYGFPLIFLLQILLFGCLLIYFS